MHDRVHSHRTVIAAVTLVLVLAAPGAALAAFGAIAVNTTTNAWGISSRAATKARAERLAKRHCHTGCRILVWVRNECAAAVETATSYFAGWAPSRKAAIGRARARAHDRHARLLAWTCSG